MYHYGAYKIRREVYRHCDEQILSAVRADSLEHYERQADMGKYSCKHSYHAKYDKEQAVVALPRLHRGDERVQYRQSRAHYELASAVSYAVGYGIVRLDISVKYALH